MSTFYSRLKPAHKIVGGIAIAISLWFGLPKLATILPSNLAKVLVPKKANLNEVKEAEKKTGIIALPLPSATPVSVSNKKIRGEEWEWNAMQGFLFANGGPSTTKGSLMEKYHVNLDLMRQDDTGKMLEDIVKCAKEIHDGAKQCSTGANFVIIMGGASGQFAAKANAQLKALGPEYLVKVIGSTGYSRGEDACMLPPNLRLDPNDPDHTGPKSIALSPMYDKDGAELEAHGVLAGGVLFDDDVHVCQKWMGDNGILNNQNEGTFDRDAVNWINEADYITAAQDYVGGAKCEDRKEISKGKLTGKTVHVCLNGIATWTPGDVIAAKRGGLVKVASTLEYKSMMPAVIIGPSKFFNDNREEFVNLLRATYEAGDQHKLFDDVRRTAAKISSKIYADEGGSDSLGRPYTNGLFWYKYFNPVMEKDGKGILVSMGGSSVNNLEDNNILFGIADGYTDNFRATYTTFADIDKQQGPNLFGDKGTTPIPPVSQVEDLSYLLALGQLIKNGDADKGGAAETATYGSGAGDVISTHAYYIPFATGSATPLPAGNAELAKVLTDISVTGLKIRISGYTDNTGSAEINKNLSQARADEVKTWLQAHAKNNFRNDRFDSVQGFGPANPVGDNNTTAGKAANRRVEITLTN